MACSKQAGVAPFLHVIEAATGEKVTQSEWHAIRVLAAEASGEDLSRARVSENEAIYALYYLQWLNAKLIKGDEEMERNHDAAVLAAALDIRAATTNVTKGTIATINYLSENGVGETLSLIRGEAPAEYADICDECEDNVCSMEHDHSEWRCYCTACYNSYNSVATDEAEQSVGADPHSLEPLHNYEVWKISSEDGPRSVAAFHELERRALPDLEELRSSYSQYPDNALEQPTLLMDKLAPAMREFERLEGDKETPKADLEKLASLVSDAAEDANYHTFNSWFMERSRKNGLDIESGGELRRKDELAEIAETESGY